MPTLNMATPETVVESALSQLGLLVALSCWHVASGATTRSTPCGLPAAGQSARLREAGTAREPAGLHESGEPTRAGGLEEPAGQEDGVRQDVQEALPARKL